MMLERQIESEADPTARAALENEYADMFSSLPVVGFHTVTFVSMQLIFVHNLVILPLAMLDWTRAFDRGWHWLRHRRG
jgi:hypothetical protein